MSRRKHHRRRAASFIETEETLVEPTRANSRLFDILDKLPTEGTAPHPVERTPRK